MLEHHIQKQIVQSLAQVTSLRFSDLKPDDLDNKLFNYHLKITIRDGFVYKLDDSTYALTAEGRRSWLRVSNDPMWFASNAYSVLFLVIRRKSDQAWLLYQKLTHPLLGKTGFMHTTPEATRMIIDTASQAVASKTSLMCDFKYFGSGYFKMFEGDSLQSFTHFELLVCEDAQGELSQNDPSAKFYWETSPNFDDPIMIANMPKLVELYGSGPGFFVEESFNL